MRKRFKERKLFKGGNYMRKYGIQSNVRFFFFVAILYTIVRNYNRLQDTGTDKDTGVYRDTGAHVQGKLTSILVEIR